MKRLLLIILLCCSTLLSVGQDESNDALAFQYYQQGKFLEASTLLQQLFTKTKDDTYFELYYTSLLKLKKFDEAEKLVKKLVKEAPANLTYKLALARVYQEKGQVDAANKMYLETINSLPKDEFKIREIANIFYGFQAYDLAIATYVQARKIFNDEKRFTFELLTIYRYKKDKNLLIQEYLNALGSMPELLPQAESVLSNLLEEKSDYQILQSALLKKIQKEPEVEVYNKLLIWQYLQQQEYEIALRQLIAQDKRTKDDGSMLFNAANTFVANEAYSTAIKAFEYLISKGKAGPYFLPAKVELIDAKYQLAIAGQINKTAIAELAGQYLSLIEEYGKTPQTVFALKKLANLEAYYLEDPSKAEKALEDALKVPGLSAREIGEIKLDLGDIYILTNQPWEAFLIYEQVAKQYEGQPIGNEAHYRSAKLSFYQGNFPYAKSQADVLKAATSQLIANDALNLSLLISDNLQNTVDSNALKMYADAELLEFRNLPAQALAKLDSIAIAFPGNRLVDDIFMAKSKIFIKTNQIENAVEALKGVIDQPSGSVWLDDALFTLAQIYEKDLKDEEQAKALYQRLINDHPGSMHTAEARKRFRKLRGDIVGT
jgi:TolA-binding protein